MHSTLTSRAGDDPHDVVVVPSDAVRVAPADDEISSLLQQAARQRVDAPTRVEPSFAVGAMEPPVDAGFRAVSIDDVLPQAARRSPARRALRGLIALLLAACLGGAALVWKAYGDVAARQVAKLTTQLVRTAWPPAEEQVQSAQAESSAAAADPATDASPPPDAPAQSAAQAAPPAAAAPVDQAQLLQSMASDLAGVRQEVEQLKASLAELKASQARDAGKAVDVKASDVRAPAAVPRPKLSAAAVRPAAAHARKPMPPYPPTQAAAPQAIVPQAAAAYVPPPPAAPYARPEPQPRFAAEPPPSDPELAVVPRPPLGMRD